MGISEIKETIQSCKHCFMCRHACPTFLATKLDSHTPRGYALLLAEIEEGKIEWSESIVNRFYQCSQCGLCREDCEYHWQEDELVRNAREEIVAAGLAPKRVLDTSGLFIKQGYFEKGQELESIGRKVIEGGNPEILYYGGWSVRAYQPHIVASIQKIMKKLGADWGMLENEIDTGITLFELGYTAQARSQAKRLRDEIAAIGPQTIVTSCAHSYRAFVEQWAKLGIALPSEIKVLHVSQFLDGLLKDGAIKPETNLIGRSIGYHDPCHLGRNGGIFDEPRQIITKLSGKKPIELFHNRNKAECCGAGSALFLTDGDLAMKVAHERLKSAREQGVDMLVTACSNCKTNFERSARQYGVIIEIKDIAELFALSLTEGEGT
jgi:Fe-S oxidoreductase